MKSLKNKTLFLILILTGILVFSQQEKIKYTVIKDSYLPHQKDTLIYYYTLDFNKSILIKKKRFYQFTFDSDSTNISGYISFEGKAINFSSDKIHYKKISFCKTTTDIKYFVSFGSRIDIIPVGDNIYDVIQKNTIPSHKLFITRIYWRKNEKYPKKIFFREVGSSKEFVSSAVKIL